MLPGPLWSPGSRPCISAGLSKGCAPPGTECGPPGAPGTPPPSPAPKPSRPAAGPMPGRPGCGPMGRPGPWAPCGIAWICCWRQWKEWRSEKAAMNSVYSTYKACWFSTCLQFYGFWLIRRGVILLKIKRKIDMYIKQVKINHYLFILCFVVNKIVIILGT